MAQKKITDLQLISSLSDSANWIVDNGIQTYRSTGTQLKDYILAAQSVVLSKLKNDIFTGLTGVAPADDDYLPLVDTSDSNLTKKGLVGSFRRKGSRAFTVGSDTMLATDNTIYISGSTGNLQLPLASGVTPGHRFTIKHVGTSLTNLYTLTTQSGALLEGLASGSIVMATYGETFVLECDGTNFYIIDHYCNTVPTTRTPTGTWSTNVTYTGRWWREGKFYNEMIQITASGAPTGACTVNLPITIDTGALTSAVNGQTTVDSNGSVLDSGTAIYTSVKGRFLTGGTSLDVTCETLNVSTGAAINATNPMTWVSGDVLIFNIKVPVSGWYA